MYKHTHMNIIAMYICMYVPMATLTITEDHIGTCKSTHVLWFEYVSILLCMYMYNTVCKHITHVFS